MRREKEEVEDEAARAMGRGAEREEDGGETRRDGAVRGGGPTKTTMAAARGQPAARGRVLSGDGTSSGRAALMAGSGRRGRGVTSGTRVATRGDATWMSVDRCQQGSSRHEGIGSGLADEEGIRIGLSWFWLGDAWGLALDGDGIEAGSRERDGWHPRFSVTSNVCCVWGLLLVVRTLSDISFHALVRRERTHTDPATHWVVI